MAQIRQVFDTATLHSATVKSGEQRAAARKNSERAPDRDAGLESYHTTASCLSY